MGYSTKIQQITRLDYNQYYVNLPRAIAKAMNFSKGEIVEWEIEGKDTLMLKRRKVEDAGKKRI